MSYVGWGGPGCTCVWQLPVNLVVCGWSRVWAGQPGTNVLWCPFGLIGVSSGQGVWECAMVILQVDQSTWVELLPTLSRCRENVNSGVHRFLRPWRTLTAPQPSLCFCVSPTPLLVMQKLFSWPSVVF